jgi:hypothetical protein
LKPKGDINVNDIGTATDEICAFHFASGDANTVYQFAFSTGDYYSYAPSMSESGAFDQLFENNRLYYYTGQIGDHTMFWYGYAQEEGS